MEEYRCLAGIMGAKHTSLLIPLCHNIPLNDISVKLSLDASASTVDIWAEACTIGKTGDLYTCTNAGMLSAPLHRNVVPLRE